MGEYTVLRLQAGQDFIEAGRAFADAESDYLKKKERLEQDAHLIVLKLIHAITDERNKKFDALSSITKSMSDFLEKGTDNIDGKSFSEYATEKMREDYTPSYDVGEYLRKDALNYADDLKEFNNSVLSRNNLRRAATIAKKRMDLLENLDKYGGLDAAISINKKLLQLTPNVMSMGDDERKNAKDKLILYFQENTADVPPHVQEFVETWLRENS